MLGVILLHLIVHNNTGQRNTDHSVSNQESCNCFPVPCRITSSETGYTWRSKVICFCTIIKGWAENALHPKTEDILPDGVYLNWNAATNYLRLCNLRTSHIPWEKYIELGENMCKYLIQIHISLIDMASFAEIATAPHRAIIPTWHHNKWCSG